MFPSGNVIHVRVHPLILGSPIHRKGKILRYILRKGLVHVMRSTGPHQPSTCNLRNLWFLFPDVLERKTLDFLNILLAVWLNDLQGGAQVVYQIEGNVKSTFITQWRVKFCVGDQYFE